MLNLCGEVITSRSKYDKLQPRLCQKEKGHAGPHSEFPFLEDLNRSHPNVARKIIRDSFMTTGAAWKSEDAGPNRILRWVMRLPDDELLEFGLDMTKLKPQVVAKLREKAATCDACMGVAKKLTWLAYQMPAAPDVSPATRAYLEAAFGPLAFGSTNCLICLGNLSFTLFSAAVRGRAHIETGHSNPRSHSAGNVGFAHRECNIAQGNKTLPEFYQWLREILARVS